MCSRRWTLAPTPSRWRRNGLKTMTQDKVGVDALQVVGLNLSLQIGTGL